MLVVIGFIVAAITALQIASSIVFFEPLGFSSSEFWLANVGGLTAYLSYLALAFFASVARITFASDNRSTRLRIVMFVQHCLFAAWMAAAWFWPGMSGEELLFILYAFLIAAGVHWFAMGALMTGESPGLSPRVKRKLPQSFLGRALLTWFNPGPGTGYVFALCGAAAALAMVFAALLTGNAVLAATARAFRAVGNAERLLAFGVAGVSYLAIYLGAGALAIRALRRFLRIDPLTGLLVHVVLVVLGCVIPLLIETLFAAHGVMEWNLGHASNLFWTLSHVVEAINIQSYDVGVLMAVLPSLAIVAFLANVPGIVREVRQVRVAPPPRIAQEEAMLAPPPPPPQPLSPWD